MSKKTVIEQYIEEKAKKHEIIDYELLNRGFKKCEFCKRLFHPQGIYKHKMYCKMNPDRKKGYDTKRKWKCRFCELLFKFNKERNLHETRCAGNPQVIIIQSRLTKKDKLSLFKKEFPEIFNILTTNQIRKFLLNKDITKKGLKNE